MPESPPPGQGSFPESITLIGLPGRNIGSAPNPTGRWVRGGEGPVSLYTFVRKPEGGIQITAEVQPENFTEDEMRILRGQAIMGG